MSKVKVEEVKQPDVGPKIVTVTFGSKNTPLVATFQSSIALNRHLDLMLIEPAEASVSTSMGNVRAEISGDDINSIWFASSNLLTNPESQTVIELSLSCSNGHLFTIPIVGENRFRIVFQSMKRQMMMSPDPDRTDWLKLPQDEGKAAFIRFRSPIQALYSRVAWEPIVT